MSGPHVEIRAATDDDRYAIRALYRAAFPPRENSQVGALAADLLSASPESGVFSLVAEADRGLVGHVAFSPVHVAGGGADDWLGYIMAPLAVEPREQKQGIGAALIEAGVLALETQGANLLFVYGDPAYYGRFEFSADAAAGYRPPHALEYPFGWQARVLGGAPQAAADVALTCVAALDDPALW
jgi:putative acetyltransferase